MRRKLPIFIAAVSLLLCAAICVLWVRSGRRSDYASVAPAWRALVCMTFPGGLKFSTWPTPVEPGGFKFASYEYGVRNAYGAWMNRPLVSWSKLGFDLRPLQFSNQTKPDRGAFELFIPFWFLTAAFLVLPLSLFVRLARGRRRERENRCARCGYDLRASPGRCPECGTVPEYQPEPAA
jgi:hypothetical protein